MNTNPQQLLHSYPIAGVVIILLMLRILIFGIAILCDISMARALRPTLGQWTHFNPATMGAVAQL